MLALLKVVLLFFSFSFFIEWQLPYGKIYFLCKNCHKLKKANIYKV